MAQNYLCCCSCGCCCCCCCSSNRWSVTFWFFNLGGIGATITRVDQPKTHVGIPTSRAFTLPKELSAGFNLALVWFWTIFLHKCHLVLIIPASCAAIKHLQNESKDLSKWWILDPLQYDWSSENLVNDKTSLRACKTGRATTAGYLELIFLPEEGIPSGCICSTIPPPHNLCPSPFSLCCLWIPLCRLPRRNDTLLHKYDALFH